MGVNVELSPSVAVKLIELISAVRDNDLAQTIEAVEFINHNYVPAPGAGDSHLNDIIVISDLLNQYNNESFKYLIHNLNHIFNAASIQWQSEINELSSENDYDKIESFIRKYLTEGMNSDALLPSYQINGMIRLATISQNYDLLKEIKDYLISKEE